MRATFIAMTSLIGATFAQDGGQLFDAYCSACHAPDGKGATGGQFHPLPKPTSALENLISYQYEGSWKQLPDFSKLEPIGVEEEHDGFMLTSIAENRKNFGLVWEGELVLHKEGQTRFRLNADDGARLIIDGETIVEVDDIGPIAKNRTKIGRVHLKGKRHKVRVE